MYVYVPCTTADRFFCVFSTEFIIIVYLYKLMLNINKYKWQRVIYKQFEMAINTIFRTLRLRLHINNQWYLMWSTLHTYGWVSKWLLFVRRSFHSNNNLQWFLYKYKPINNKVHATFWIQLYSHCTFAKKWAPKLLECFFEII